jgi:hypothetical protein
MEAVNRGAGRPSAAPVGPSGPWFRDGPMTANGTALYASRLEDMRRAKVPNIPDTNSAGAQRTELSRVGAGGWALIAVLGLFLVFAAGFAIYAWRALGGVEISESGWIAMAIGVAFTAFIGCGLMALVFYSNRRNYDR